MSAGQPEARLRRADLRGPAMTTQPTAHREGNARMTRAMSGSTALYFRVAGHAGVWELDGHALVLTDDDQFEHPTQLVVHQVADPDRFAVVEAADLTPFTPADTRPVGAVA